MPVRTVTEAANLQSDGDDTTSSPRSPSSATLFSRAQPQPPMRSKPAAFGSPVREVNRPITKCASFSDWVPSPEYTSSRPMRSQRSRNQTMACSSWMQQLSMPALVMSVAATAVALLLLCVYIGRGTAVESAFAVASSHTSSQTAQRLSAKVDAAATHDYNVETPVLQSASEEREFQLQLRSQMIPRKLFLDHPVIWQRQQSRNRVRSH